MRRNMLNNKFYKYGEKVYMLVATNTNIEFDFLKEEEFEFELSEMRHGR